MNTLVRHIALAFRRSSVLFCLAIVLALSGSAFGVTYTTTTSTDPIFTSVNPVTGAITAGAGVGLVSLRSAVAAANSQAGPHIINLPPGTYLLSASNGGAGLTPNDLVVGSNVNLDTTIQGSDPLNPQNTVIKMNVAGNDVIETAFDTLTSQADLPMKLTLKNLEVTGGDSGGIFTGADNGTARSQTIIDHCLITGNTNGTTFAAGAITVAGGDLTVTNTTVSNNTSLSASFGQGAGINYTLANATGAFSQGTLLVQDSIFSNNTAGIGATFPAGAGIFVSVIRTNSLTVDRCTFTGNRATGGGDGGAIAVVNTNPTIAITRNNFSGNQVTTASGRGGAISVQGGTANINFNRFATNSATTAANGRTINVTSGTVNANDNWWASSTGPAVNDLRGTITATNWLLLKLSASPTSVLPSGTAALTASFLSDSANGAVAVANLTQLIGQTISFGGDAFGSTSGADATIQAAGTAAATFTGTNPGVSTVSALVDGGTATTSVTVIAPPTLTSLTPGSGPQGAINLSVAILGSNTHFVQGTSVAGFGAGITVNSLTATDATHATANISIPVATAVGSRNVTITTGGEIATLTNGFTVTAQVPTQMTANSGTTPQSATVNTAFANALAVTVKDAFNNPVSGVNVTFTAPGSGASGTFSNSTATITVATSASGVATAPFTANGTVGGPYTVTATAASLTTVNFSLSNTGAGPVIATNPTDVTINAGGTAVFTAAASGSPTPTVQWQFSTDGGATFQNVAGAISTTLTVPNVAAGQNGTKFRAVFTNAVGTATTTAATLTVNFAPTVTTNPLSQSISAGSNVSFTVAASGNPTPTVQWFTSTDGGSTFVILAGATNPTLSFVAQTALNGVQYRAVFTNTVGTATTTAATLTVTAGPVITTNPVNVTVNAGGTAVFTAAASGSPTPTVQWQFSTDGGTTFQNVAGAITTTLTVPNVAAGQNGTKFRAVFTNASGTATTTAATMTVNFAPTVTTNPVSQSISAGSNVSFTVAASGNPTPTVQWFTSTDGGSTFVILAGATNPTLSFVAQTALNGVQYRAVFTNTVGTATTTAATLTVTAGPVVTTNPISVTINAGGTAVFTAAASGSPTPTVQWQFSTDGGATFQNVAGAITTTLTVPNVAAGQNGTKFRAVFTNASGTATTAAATMTVTTGNRPPVAGLDSIERYPTQSTKVLVSTLLANDNDPDGDTPLTITSVNAAASGQATVTMSGGYVFYLPNAGFTTADSFTYNLSDGHGGTAVGTVTVTIHSDNAQSQNITKLEMLGDGSVRVSFAGIPGLAYRVQSTDSLAPANWVDRATQTADAQGKFEFTDPPPPPATRFYRSVFP